MVASNAKEAAYAISWFQASGKGVVVKPQGLTGGKGVKVMPEHLQTYGDCTYYAQSLLEKNPKEKVLIVERLEGIEFTIMGITDGRNIVLCPASYDYPFRYEDDRGPGTGGMGCFTDRKEKLPFMTDSDLDDCKGIMQRIIDEVSANGMLFKGVLNGGFFKTKEGIRFMEFNARFGDPEGLNILSILDSSFSELLIKIWDGGLSKEDVLFARKASVIKYLVAKEYPESSKDTVSFAMDEDSIRGLDVGIFFAACVRTGRNRYRTLKSSRVVALGATAECITEASDMINDAIERHVTGPLEYRNDIGSDKNLEKLQKTFQ